jgi:uracil-DNA glycosylase family 4
MIKKSKKLQIEKLAKEIRVCKNCRLWKSRRLAVPGEGDPKAKILFLGESPGGEEDRTGRPFVGSSGKFLNALFRKICLDRKKVFITSVIKCHPPENRNPRADELAACKAWWQKQIKIIQPKLIVLLGTISLKTVLGQDNISKCHGKKIIRRNIIYFPTFHPAAGLRFPAVKKKIIQDFERLDKLIF